MKLITHKVLIALLQKHRRDAPLKHLGLNASTLFEAAYDLDELMQECYELCFTLEDDDHGRS